MNEKSPTPKKRGRPKNPPGEKVVVKNYGVTQNQAALLEQTDNASEEVRKALALAGFPEQSNKSEQ